MGKGLVQYDWNCDEYEHPYRDPELLRTLYWGERMSLTDISDMIGCGRSTVGKWMSVHDIPRRKPDDEKYPRPRTQSENASGAGYEVIVHHHGDEKYQVFHHRLIAVAEWGLDALEGVHVHHENGLEWDNRIENLQLKDPKDHSRDHRLEEPNDDPWHDRELLYEEYVEKGESMYDLGEQWGCNPVTVHNWLHRFDIETRDKNGEF